MRRTIPLACFLLLASACGDRLASDGEDEAALETPRWSPCASKGEVETCAELCAEHGLECSEDACPADPDFCDPEPCDQATQVLALDAEALCADPSVGTFVATTCDAPIDWLFSNTVRCCCAESS